MCAMRVVCVCVSLFEVSVKKFIEVYTLNPKP